MLNFKNKMQNLLKDEGVKAILQNDYSKALRYIIDFSERYGQKFIQTAFL